MSGKDLKITFAFLLLILALQGCSQTTDSNVAKNSSVNQPAPSSNIATTDNSFANSKAANITVSNSNANTAVNNSPALKSSEQKPITTVGANDLAIFTLIRSKLFADKDLVNSVVVDVKGGNVILSGKVSNEEQKKKAGDIVQNIQGIKSVKNNLSIAP